MIHHGFKLVTVAGVAEPLATSSTPAAFITFYPRTVSGTPNTGEIRVGGRAVGATTNPTSIPPGSGIPLNPGDAGVAWPNPAPAAFDLMTIYIDADNSGDGIQYVFGR